MRQRMEAVYTADRYLGAAYALCMEARRGQEREESYLLRIGLNKELQDEMVPIGYFCKQFFVEDPELVRVGLVLGSQAYDAKVEDRRSDGSGLEFLEVSCIEGVEEHRARESMLDKGVAEMTASTQDIFDMILRLIRKKASKLYPDNTALILYSKVVYPRALFECFEIDYGAHYRPVIDAKFRAVFIVDREKLLRL